MTGPGSAAIGRGAIAGGAMAIDQQQAAHYAATQAALPPLENALQRIDALRDKLRGRVNSLQNRLDLVLMPAPTVSATSSNMAGASVPRPMASAVVNRLDDFADSLENEIVTLDELMDRLAT